MLIGRFADYPTTPNPRGDLLALGRAPTTPCSPTADALGSTDQTSRGHPRPVNNLAPTALVAGLRRRQGHRRRILHPHSHRRSHRRLNTTPSPHNTTDPAGHHPGGAVILHRTSSPSMPPRHAHPECRSATRRCDLRRDGSLPLQPLSSVLRRTDRPTTCTGRRRRPACTRPCWSWSLSIIAALGWGQARDAASDLRWAGCFLSDSRSPHRTKSNFRASSREARVQWVALYLRTSPPKLCSRWFRHRCDYCKFLK